MPMGLDIAEKHLASNLADGNPDSRLIVAIVQDTKRGPSPAGWESDSSLPGGICFLARRPSSH